MVYSLSIFIKSECENEQSGYNYTTPTFAFDDGKGLVRSCSMCYISVLPRTLNWLH